MRKGVCFLHGTRVLPKLYAAMRQKSRTPTNHTASLREKGLGCFWAAIPGAGEGVSRMDTRIDLSSEDGETGLLRSGGDVIGIR